MRAPQRDLRGIYKLLEQIVDAEPRPIALTDDEIAERINKRMRLDPPLSANRVWYYRKLLAIPANGKRRKQYIAERNNGKA